MRTGPAPGCQNMVERFLLAPLPCAKKKHLAILYM